MVKQLLAIASFIINCFGWSQSVYAPLDANWNYHAEAIPIMDRTVRVIHDTTINGNPVKTINLTTFTGAGPSNDTSTVEQLFGKIELKNDSVFYFPYNTFPNNGRFLFGFNMLIADTIQIETDPGYTLIAIVDTLYNVNVSGFTVKKWELSKYCDGNFMGNATVIENIGLVDDFFTWETYGCSDMSWYTPFVFECYGSNSLSLNPPCNPIVLAIEELDINPSQLVKVCDYMGRETAIVKNAPLLFYYSNGKVERKVIVE